MNSQTEFQLSSNALTKEQLTALRLSQQIFDFTPPKPAIEQMEVGL